MNTTCEGDPSLACCILPKIAFPAPWTNRFQTRQISRLPCPSLRNCQQINRSSQYSNSLQIEPMFSITSLNLCSPWSSLSLCLCSWSASFISTTIIFPFNNVAVWPGYIDLNLLSKCFKPIIIFMLLCTFSLFSVCRCLLVLWMWGQD